MLAGCGRGSTPLSPLPGSLPAALRTAERTHARLAYRVLYSFKGGSKDGANPFAGLINVNGTLYGTTEFGGAHCEASSRGGCGTVFAITKSGAEKVLHSFGASGDGRYPVAGLINVNGTLYGTTYNGGSGCGSPGCGTVFAITPSGAETVLYRFSSGDGAHPFAGLINVNGTLYGTTFNGGGYYDGTVFKITTSGEATTLHSFGASGDGYYPRAGLINVKATLYGTTLEGGSYCLGTPRAAVHPLAALCGTVFAITTSGTETVLYSFKGGRKDGAYPDAGLINVSGTLYGTTTSGGKYCTGSYNCGTVFSITTSGKETVLHSFGSGLDGADPFAGLLNVKGRLYGTTPLGGATSGGGTVFAITPSGAETVLYRFGSPGDGFEPEAGLINVSGTLYGTTTNGGKYCTGGYNCGTVFSLSP
jgi:uncharacterized repeat protein (TIGR03803 family)